MKRIDAHARSRPVRQSLTQEDEAMETKPKPEVGGRWSIEREAFNLEQIHILERIAVGAPLKEVLDAQMLASNRRVIRGPDGSS